MSSSARKTKCGFTRKPCMEHECVHYQHIQGKHPQTGEPLDKWDCAFNIHTMLLLDQGRAVQNLDGEISKFRSEQAKAAESFGAFMTMLSDIIANAPARNRGLANGEAKRLTDEQSH